jgi:hypothetical protein
MLARHEREQNEMILEQRRVLDELTARYNSEQDPARKQLLGDEGNSLLDNQTRERDDLLARQKAQLASVGITHTM